MSSYLDVNIIVTLNLKGKLCLLEPKEMMKSVLQRSRGEQRHRAKQGQATALTSQNLHPHPRKMPARKNLFNKAVEDVTMEIGCLKIQRGTRKIAMHGLLNKREMAC